jgi:4-amino-4-deoxy-L-arabinose transferase-like glycosyltransferase
VWAVAVGLLLLRALLLAASVSPDRALTGDEAQYDGPARSLLLGQGFSHHGEPWVWKPPLWPLILAGIKSAFGHDHRAAVFAQGLFDAGTALLAWFVARRIFASARAAWLLFAVVALWPPFLRESRFLQTEPLYTLGVAAMLAEFVRFAEQRTPWRGFLLGVVIGLTSLVRPTGFAAAVSLLAAWAMLDRTVLRSWKALLPIALGAILVLTPWTVRNARVFHAFIPFSTGGGEVFAMGTSTTTDGRWHMTLWVKERREALAPEEARLGRPLTIPEADRALYRVGLRRWQDDPGAQAWLWLKRLWRTVALPVRSDGLPLRAAFLAVLAALYALAIAGARVAWRRGDVTGRLGMAVLVAYFAHALLISGVAASSRYTEPVRTMLLLLAAGAVAAWWPGGRAATSEPAAR